MSAWWHRLRPYLLLALFALPALWPFTQPGLPRTNDNLPHYYRTVELDQLVRAGVLFPRWAPDLVHGYGYPVFNFFPYLAHAVVEGFHLLGLNFLPAFKAASALFLLATAWFAFRLGREHFGEDAGLVVGVAYLYSPYLLYDTHTRGSLPEACALAVLPLAMLYLRRAAQGQPRAAAWAGAWLAVFVLSHPGVALQTMPFLVGYTWLENRPQHPMGQGMDGLGRWPALRRAASPFLLTGLLSAFFWLPAMSEARYVQIERGTHSGSMSYVNNFLTVRELVALPRLPVDPDLLNPPVVRALPLAALVFAALALLRRFVFLRRLATPALHPHTHILAYFLFAALLAACLILPIARPLWDAVPLLQYTLFPWRLLGPTSLFVALLAGALFANGSSSAEQDPAQTGAGAGHRHGMQARKFPLAAAVLLLIIAGLPFASPPFEEVPAAPTLADVATFEIGPDFVGTTTLGEYLPIWVKRLPDTTANREHLRRGEPIEKFETIASPAGVSATDEAAPPHIAGASPGSGTRLRDTFHITSHQPFTFVYRTFYFPGWRATLDGRPATIRITYPEGLMAVDIPAGESVLSFQFGPTPSRIGGLTLSIIGILAALWPIRPWGRGVRDASAGMVASPVSSPASSLLFALAAVLALSRPLLYDAGRTPLLRRGLRAEGLGEIGRPLNLEFAGELTLLAWDTSADFIGADDSVTVELYWKATHRLGIPYGFDVRLVDDRGLTWSERGPRRPRDWRFTPGTDFWPVDQYILDPYTLTPLAGTPPDAYTLQVTVFMRHNLQSIGTQPVGRIAVTAPSRERACVPGEAAARPLGALELQSVGLSAPHASPGDDVVVSLCWRAEDSLPGERAAELRLLNDQGSVVAAQPFGIGGAYPTARWVAGEVVRDQVSIRLPAMLVTGEYGWVLSSANESVALGSLQVTAPPRTFVAPPAALILDASLGPVTLFGIGDGLPPEPVAPGSPLAVKLIWQAAQTPPGAYHVFLHLLDAAGTLVAQSDGVPADWSRPTTGWLHGEFVADARTLALPPDLAPGTYTLFAGMYTPAGGERLTTPAFPDGRVRLGEVRIGK